MDDYEFVRRGPIFPRPVPSVGWRERLFGWIVLLTGAGAVAVVVWQAITGG